MSQPSNTFVTAYAGRMAADDLSADCLPTLDRPVEATLVAQAVAGDREAFGQLVVLHERVALRTALAALCREEDAADVVQEAFLLAWRRLPTFRHDATFRTWLLTIVWREAQAKRKVRQRWWQRFTSVGPVAPDTGRFALAWVTGEADPEQCTLDRELAERTARAIAGLPQKLRDTLLLAASGEHAYSEIGKVLGVAEGTIKWRVAEARRLVRQALEGHREG